MRPPRVAILVTVVAFGPSSPCNRHREAAPKRRHPGVKCHRFWTLLFLWRVKRVNIHGDAASGGPHLCICRCFWILVSSSPVEMRELFTLTTLFQNGHAIDYASAFSLRVDSRVVVRSASGAKCGFTLGGGPNPILWAVGPLSDLAVHRLRQCSVPPLFAR